MSYLRSDDGMRSDVFMREDLAAILRSIALTATATAGGAPAPHAAAYRRGFAAALAAVATATHIPLASITPREGSICLTWRS